MSSATSLPLRNLETPTSDASSFAFENEMSAIAECSICMEEFTSAVPRLLPCGHTFCHTCLAVMSKKGAIECPSCRAKHSVQPGAEFSKNYALEELLLAVSYNKLESPSASKAKRKSPRAMGYDAPLDFYDAKALFTAPYCEKMCDQCEAVPPTVTCCGCPSTLAFCQRCFDQVHKAMPACFTKSGAHISAPYVAQLKRCAVHSAHFALFFCETDNVLICRECCRSTHAKHTFSSIKSAATRKRTLLENELQRARESIEALRGKQDARCKELATHADQLHRVEGQLAALFSDLHHSVDIAHARFTAETKQSHSTVLARTQSAAGIKEQLRQTESEHLTQIAGLLESVGKSAHHDTEFLTGGGTEAEKVLEQLLSKCRSISEGPAKESKCENDDRFTAVNTSSVESILKAVKSSIDCLLESSLFTAPKSANAASEKKRQPSEEEEDTMFVSSLFDIDVSDSPAPAAPAPAARAPPRPEPEHEELDEGPVPFSLFD